MPRQTHGQMIESAMQRINGAEAGGSRAGNRWESPPQVVRATPPPAPPPTIGGRGYDEMVRQMEELQATFRSRFFDSGMAYGGAPQLPEPEPVEEELISVEKAIAMFLIKKGVAQLVDLDDDYEASKSVFNTISGLKMARRETDSLVHDLHRFREACFSTTLRVNLVMVVEEIAFAVRPQPEPESTIRPRVGIFSRPTVTTRNYNYNVPF